MKETELISGKRVVLVVTGGIAAYKACEIVRRLRDRGAEVRVAMTRSATQFVGPLTFAALSGHRVVTSLFDDDRPQEIPHIRWAEWADLMVVVPGTAGFLAKMAHGVADDFASTLYLANSAATLVAPAMEDDMYRHPTVQRNLATLAADGVAVVGPATGALASGRSGPGRMSEPADVVGAAVRVLRHGVIAPDLVGQHVMITAGPTYEALDPVRGFTNRSSGQMGYALAQEAVLRGGRVTLVSGPTALHPPAGVTLRTVDSAAEMAAAANAIVDSVDTAVLCAAVCDFTPNDPATSKLKKNGSAGLEVSLRRTDDILAGLAGLEKRPFTVGFAAETERLREHAAEKLERKGCDMIVGNLVGGENDVMGSSENSVIVLDRCGGAEEFARAPKSEIAMLLWAAIGRAKERMST